MILDSYRFPEAPEVDAQQMVLHIVNVSPKEYIEVVVDDRRFLVAKLDSSFKIGDLIHFKPMDEATVEPTLFNRLKRFFRGDSEAFNIYSEKNLFVITCRENIPDTDYTVLGLRNLRA